MASWAPTTVKSSGRSREVSQEHVPPPPPPVLFHLKIVTTMHFCVQCVYPSYLFIHLNARWLLHPGSAAAKCCEMPNKPILPSTSYLLTHIIGGGSTPSLGGLSICKLIVVQCATITLYKGALPWHSVIVHGAKVLIVPLLWLLQFVVQFVTIVWHQCKLCGSTTGGRGLDDLGP